MINKTRKWIIRISVALTAVFCACGAAACGAPKQLDMPENLQLEGRMLTWDEVEDADGYAVYVDDQEYIVEDNAFEIPFLAGPKTYQVEVMALGDWKKTKDSVCGEIEYTKVIAEAEGEKDGFHFVLMDDLESYEIVACDNKEGYVEFPDDYLDYPVKKIGKALFAPPRDEQGRWIADFETGEGCNKITTGVKLPRYLEEIGENAFSHCYALQEVVMPDSVTVIEKGAFFRCYILRDIQLPSSLRTVGNEAFMYAVYDTQELIFPDGIESIGMRAFETGQDGDGINLSISSKLEKVVIPGTIKKVETWAFSNHQSLREIDIQTDNIEEWGYGVFRDSAWYENQPDGLIYIDKVLYRCKGELPENYKLTVNADVVGIAASAFKDQKNLTEVWIADGVKFLGSTIFADTGLTSVRLPADLPCLPDYTFSGADEIRVIEIPETVTEIGSSALRCKGLNSGKVILHGKCKIAYNSFHAYGTNIVYQGIEYKWWTGGAKLEGIKYCYIDEQGYFAIWE